MCKFEIHTTASNTSMSRSGGGGGEGEGGEDDQIDHDIKQNRG